MEDEEIIEVQGNGTAGLTSANQIIDFTDSVSFSNTNMTCATPQHLYPLLLLEKSEMKHSQIQVFSPLLFREERFRKALDDSIRKNKTILRELAKY